jgi:hypothetical protein
LCGFFLATYFAHRFAAGYFALSDRRFTKGVADNISMPNPAIAGLYVRVSTDKQDYSFQLHDLRRYAQRMGWQTIEYAEKESSVKRPLSHFATQNGPPEIWPQLNQMPRAAAEQALGATTLRSGVRPRVPCVSRLALKGTPEFRHSHQRRIRPPFGDWVIVGRKQVRPQSFGNCFGRATASSIYRWRSTHSRLCSTPSVA